jgi:predicted 2-oxoglutarate/Fe(II)-dependent dioxygenase YbiX
VTAVHANRSTSIVCRPFLSPEDLEVVRSGLDELTFRPAQMVAGVFTGEHRDVRCAEAAVGLDAGLTARIESEIARINEEVFGFDITGFRRDDPVNVLRYRRDGHFVWHLDNGASRLPVASRKLSFTIQLSGPDDYDGGDLEFAMYAPEYDGGLYGNDRESARRAGALIAFPSFHLHRVRPVTRGIRVAIVGWLHGPPFR